MTGADRYAAWLPRPPAGVHEEDASSLPVTLPEMEVQARWFSGEFGKTFFTVSGDTVEIVQFGVWNRESGPDFRDAAVSINGAPPIRGSIEIDPDVRDWERHGHSVHPAYDNVVLHVFWNTGKSELFTRAPAGRAIPQVRLDLERINRVPLNPISDARTGRCSAPLAAMEPGKAGGLLAAAAHYRLQRKAHRICQAVESHGESEALYQFLAETLGYKSNKLTFLLLAQRLPVGQLRKRRAAMEAVLFGVSGFLTATDLRDYPEATRSYLRDIWENWWPRRSEFGNLVLSSRQWKCGGVRPLNHPHRRVAALAGLARCWPKAREILGSADPRAIGRFFASLSHDYWDYHYTLTSRPSPRAMALIGPDRVAGILVNVALPLALRDKPSSFEKMETLPAPDFNLRVRIAALRLFGTSARQVPLLKTAIRQQGLLQIYDDFCCQDVSDCIRCKLPDQLRQWN